VKVDASEKKRGGGFFAERQRGVLMDVCVALLELAGFASESDLPGTLYFQYLSGNMPTKRKGNGILYRCIKTKQGGNRGV
jgi:hypothetical protein